MNLIDRAFRVIAPEAALRREKARRALSVGDKIGYWRQAAVASSNRKMSGQSLGHPDSSSNHNDRITLIREARHLEENNSIIASILRKYETFAVGRLQYIPRTQSDAANKAIKTYVERWFTHSDVTGRHSFRALAGLAVKSMKRDGDIGFIVSEVEPDPLLDAFGPVCPLRIQAIEADRIGAIWNAGQHGSKPFRPLKKGEQDFSGVVVNDFGRPQRYRIFTRQTNGDVLLPWKEVPAANFLHVFDPLRFDGYRGFTAFGASINDIKDIHEILACEKQSVKYLSSISGLVEGGDGTSPDDVLLDESHAAYNADAATLKSVAPGSVNYLAQGQKFNALNYDRPSPTFAGFLDTLTRWVGLAFNLPFGFVYSWASQGTAVRMEAAQAAREFEQTQLVLEEKLLGPIIRRVIARGIQLGHLPAIPDFDMGEWRYPAKVTADVGRESKAEIEEVLTGLRSRTQIAADHGEDRELIRAMLRTEALEIVEDAKAVVAASDGELELPMALYLLEKRSANPPVEAPEPAEASTEDKSEDKPTANQAPIAPQFVMVPQFQQPAAPEKAEIQTTEPKSEHVRFVRNEHGELQFAETDTKRIKFLRGTNGELEGAEIIKS
jgi:capsid protein